MSKKIIVILIVLISILGAAGAYYVLTIYKNSNFSTTNNTNISIYIDENTTFQTLMSHINANSTQKYQGSFEKIAKYKNLDKKLRAGHYILENNMSNQALLNRLTGGMQTPVKLKFNNIRLLPQLIKTLDKQLLLDSTDLANILYDNARIDSLGFTPQTIISMFIPNTYEVYWNISADNLINRMHQEYHTFWHSKSRLDKAKKLNLTPTQVSSLASIVEGETNIDKEKPVVAGLYINRLRRGIPLQADPTVKFAVGDFTLTQILFQHLEIDSPYNTYKYVGLPPGPIAMPSISGIDAVLNYTQHNYIYMCAKESLNGEHNFATTLLQHNVNAAKYHHALRQWKRKNIK